MNPFIQQLQTEIDKKHLLKHPFYKMWEKGTLPMAVMQKYSEQYYHLERNFPIFLSLMHSGCEVFEIRQAITDNLYDEEHGPNNHTELWMRFGESIGAKRKDIQTSKPLPETAAAIQTFRNMSTSSFLHGAGALAAYESQIPKIAEKKLHGLKQNYGIDDERGAEFFKLHGVLDVKHANVWWDMIEQQVNTPERQLAVMEAVKNGRDSLWGFLDGVCREYMPEDKKLEMQKMNC
ncbi:CADD family putative folate metabolism protein [Candidatus Woesearchaeota archaeon]|nr:CADD family putative folate metabolism protein [Candidatus Woesearchaeota archaeon]